MRFKVVLAVAAVAAVLLVGAGYFLFLSSKGTEVSASVSDASVGTGQDVEVEGRVAPAAERDVRLQLRVAPDAPWTDLATGRTDTDGRFALAGEAPADSGRMQLRVYTASSGRYEAAFSEPAAVTVLASTTVDLESPKTFRSDRAAIVRGTARPGGARPVILEVSRDEQAWSAVSRASAEAATGAFQLRARNLPSGDVFLRVRAAETGSAAEAISESRAATVEDYRAAGRRYLAIVGPGNKAGIALNDAFESQDLGRIRDAARRYSDAMTVQGRNFQRYDGWPREVRDQIGILIKTCLLDADYANQVANQTTLADANAIESPDYPRGSDSAPVLIRSALGLPKRN